MIKHKSSAIAAVCGSRSLTQAPLSPCRLKSNGEPTSGKLAWLPLIVLYPVARRLGYLLEENAQTRRALRERGLGDASQDIEMLVARVAGSLEAMSARLDRIDERQAFTERLLEQHDPRARSSEASDEA